MKEENRRGRLIVFEGIDGCGKTTQLSLLRARLEADGRRAFVTSEPTCKADHVPTPAGRLIGDALRGKTVYSDTALAALFLADRVAHNTDPALGIRRFLDGGTDVICARYYYSTAVYQGNRGNLDWILSANLSCPDIVRPDLCVFLDLSPEESLARIRKRKGETEIYERGADMLAAAREKYLAVFDAVKRLDPAQNIRVLPASLPVGVLADEIYGEVKKLF